MNIAKLLKRLLMSFMFHVDDADGGGGGDDLASAFETRDGEGDTPGADDQDDDADADLDLDPAAGDPNAQQQAADDGDDPAYEIDIGGGTKKSVKLSELIQNATRFHGAQKKFEEAAAIRKDAEEKMAVLPQREQQLGQVLEYYIRESQALMSAQQPNWEALLAQNPQEYLRVRHQWEQRQTQLQQAQQARQLLEQRNAEAQTAIRQGRIQEESSKILEAIPEWSDPVKAKEGAQAVSEYLVSAGIPKEMHSQMDTAAVFLVARKAMLYDQAIARRKAGQSGVQAPTRTARPGAARTTTGAQQNRAKAEKSFTANPSVDSLAAFFE